MPISPDLQLGLSSWTETGLGWRRIGLPMSNIGSRYSQENPVRTSVDPTGFLDFATARQWRKDLEQAAQLFYVGLSMVVR